MNILNKIKKVLNAPSKPKITYDQDGLTTVHNRGFMDKADFVKAEKRGAEKVLAVDNLCGGDGVTKKQMSKYRPDGFKPGFKMLPFYNILYDL